MQLEQKKVPHTAVTAAQICFSDICLVVSLASGYKWQRQDTGKLKATSYIIRPVDCSRRMLAC